MKTRVESLERLRIIMTEASDTLKTLETGETGNAGLLKFRNLLMDAIVETKNSVLDKAVRKPRVP